MNAYTYDANGNRTTYTPSNQNQQTQANNKTHYTYEPSSDRLSIITTKDDKDNIIKQRVLTYTPDGQIKSIKDNDKLISTYQYNHLRQRIAKTT